MIALRYAARMKRKSSNRSGHIYLLRLERVQRQTETTWLVFLEPVASGNRRAFGSLDALTDFLKMEYGEVEREQNTLATVEQFPPV